MARVKETAAASRQNGAVRPAGVAPAAKAGTRKAKKADEALRAATQLAIRLDRPTLEELEKY